MVSNTHGMTEAAGADPNSGLHVHWPVMVGVCERVLRCREEAEDCASQALLDVLQAGGLRGVRNEEAWLVRIAKRRAMDAVRRDVRDRRRAARLAGRAELQASDIAEAVLDQAEAQWLSRMAEQLLSPPALAVVHAVADGYSVAEAGSRLGMTTSAAESHLARARRALRDALAATLGVLVWILTRLRRAAPAAPVAVLAAAVAVLTSPLLPTDRTPSIRAEHVISMGDVQRPAADIATQRPAQAELRTITGAQTMTVKSPARRPAQPRAVRRVSTPGAGTVVIESQQRNSPSDPVGATVWCVRHLTVSLDRVGC